MTRYEEWATRRNKFIKMAVLGLYETLELQSNGEYFIEDNNLVNNDYHHVEIMWSVKSLHEFPAIAHLNYSVRDEASIENV